MNRQAIAALLLLSLLLLTACAVSSYPTGRTLSPEHEVAEPGHRVLLPDTIATKPH